MSPRQKMINMMYIVLMAMLALNVSSGVLDGFTLIDRTLSRSKDNTVRENKLMYAELKAMAVENPKKAAAWNKKALELKENSDFVCGLCEMMKNEIIIAAEGKNADPENIKNKDNLEIPARVMLGTSLKRGQQLRDAIDAYRINVLPMISDSHKKAILETYLSTEVSDRSNKSWEEQMFESMPVAAAVTMLTKLEADIRYAEGEILHELCNAVDSKDIRVNNIQALVVPESRMIMMGNSLNAQVMMAAVDTTNVPDVFIGQNRVKDGKVSIPCSKPGTFNLTGYIVTTGNNGEEVKKTFSLPYTVLEPAATVSSDLMHMLYAGYDNPLSVSVPGISRKAISISVQGAAVRNTGDGKYILRPNAVGKNVVITVLADMNNKRQEMGKFSFSVRRLPDPSPYLTVADAKGSTQRFRGGALQRSSLLEATRLSAAVDDGLLDIPFRVKSFEMVILDAIGNAQAVASDGDKFSERQKESVRKMRRNTRLFITNIHAYGPDGTDRRLNTSMELIIK